MMEKYYIFEMIGEGSFGRVYKGRRKFSGQIVALKFISKIGFSKYELRNLKREIEIMQELRHPNIVLLLDSFETKTEVVVVTEYAESDLHETLDNDGFPESQVREIACQLLSALHYLHSHRVLHRDLKPQNILVCKGGVVKLCDFGFARAMSVSTLVLTSIKGTPLYISPEMVQEKPYDHTADLWALGCILYELHTGFPPFYSKSFIKVLQLITNDPVKWPENMSQDCKSLLKGLLNKDPQMRLTWPDLLHHPFVAGGVKVLPYEDLCCPLTIAPSPDIQAKKQQQMAKKLPRCKKDQTQNGKKLDNRQPCTRTAPGEEAPARNRSLGSNLQLCRKSAHPPADQNKASNIDLPSVSWPLCKDFISRDYETEFGPRLIDTRSRDSHTSFRKRKENKEQDSVNTDEESQQLAEVTGHTPVPLDPYIFHLKINLFRCKKQLLFGKLDEPSTILRSLNILTHFILTFDAAHVRRISEEIDVLHILFSLIKVILNRPEVMKEPWSEKVLAELMTVLLPIWENQRDWQMEKKRAEDLCQLLISQFLQSDPNALAPQAAAVLNLFVRYGVCVNIHMDRLTALLENLLSGPEKPHYPLPPGWGMCDGVLALILYFLFESESSALYDFLDSEVWSHLWTKVGTILESTASKPDFLSEDGLSVLLRITLFAFSNVPDYCLLLFLDNDKVIRILCHLLTTHNSAPHKRGLLWAGSDMNSLAIMSCQLLCFPFALELPQEKTAAILHSYQSLNIVKGLVKEIQLQSPDVLELPFSLLWRLCLAFPNYAVSSFITAAQDCGFLPQSAPLDQTLNNQKTSGSAPEQPICYPNSQQSKNTSVKVMKMGFHSKIKQDLKILSMEQDSLDQQSDDMDFLDSLEFHTGFSKHYLTAQSDISWIIDSLEHPKNSVGHTEVIKALYCPKASEVKTQPEIRTASSLLSMLLQTESMFGCAAQLLTLLCQTCTSGSALFKVPVDPVVLRAALRHHDDGVRAAGCNLLTCLNPDFRRVFTTSNAGPNWTIKPAVFMDLLNCLSDSAPSVRRKACKAVAKWLGLIRKTEVTLKRDQNLQDGTEFSRRTAKERINTRVQSIRQRTKSDSGSHLISIRTEIEWEEWLKVALQAASPAVYMLSDPDAVIRQQGCIIIEHIAAITGGRKVLMSTGASRQLLHLSRFDSHHAVQKQALYSLSFVSRTN